MSTNQEIALKTLNQALATSKINHAYLFEAGSNQTRLEYAFFFAKAICLELKALDFEKDDLYDKIVNNLYHDIIYIDGQKETIVKQQVENLFERFKYTGLENSSNKVYIINNLANSSIKVLNMLLKFMEDPSSKQCYGIILADDGDQLPLTIKSRLSRVLFLNDVQAYDFKDYTFKDQLAKTIANIIYFVNAVEFNEIEFEIILEMVNSFRDNLSDLDYFILDVFNNIYPKFKDLERVQAIFILRSFIDFLVRCLLENIIEEISFIKNKEAVIELLLRHKSDIVNMYDYKLIFDSLLKELRELINGTLY